MKVILSKRAKRGIQKIKDLGIYENSIIVFTSDHGEMMGSHGLMTKGVCFEESINVPFAVTKASDGKVVYCNEALGDLVGVPREKLIGEGMPDFYANPSDREAYISQLREQGFVNNYISYLYP